MDSAEMTTIILAIIGSQGLWTFLGGLFDGRSKKKKQKQQEMEEALARLQAEQAATAKMVRGLAYDRICYVGGKYLKRGEITFDERENFRHYLFEPYKAAGGDGTAEKVMGQIDDMPLIDTKGDLMV